MGLIFKCRKEIEAYISANGQLDIKMVALSSLVHLLKMENLTIKDLSDLFSVNIDEVKDLLTRNGLLTYIE